MLSKALGKGGAGQGRRNTREFRPAVICLGMTDYRVPHLVTD
jgi:hypothetical protein